MSHIVCCLLAFISHPIYLQLIYFSMNHITFKKFYFKYYFFYTIKFLLKNLPVANSKNTKTRYITLLFSRQNIRLRSCIALTSRRLPVKWTSCDGASPPPKHALPPPDGGCVYITVFYHYLYKVLAKECSTRSRDSERPSLQQSFVQL